MYDEINFNADARKFVQVWQTSRSVAEVAAKTRTNKGACKVRAFRYRKKGVPLKWIPASLNESIDWQELAELAETLAKEDSKGAEQE